MLTEQVPSETINISVEFDSSEEEGKLIRETTFYPEGNTCK